MNSLLQSLTVAEREGVGDWNYEATFSSLEGTSEENYVNNSYRNETDCWNTGNKPKQ